jgi:hypothetical protein
VGGGKKKTAKSSFLLMVTIRFNTCNRCVKSEIENYGS